MTDRAAIRSALLDWYDRVARDLPWRRTRDPYAIWVSEIMLQQTRVETVIPYFERFMARFPSTEALAEATEDDVLATFSGLGYYRRARLLHAGVREVVARYGGEVPVDARERLGLPGIGRYTAGAIGSIAFGLEEALVDGNVQRVLSRLFAIDSPIGQAATEKRFWSEAEALVLGDRPGDYNQALMELGATVCTKGQPKCSDCPLRKHCEAHRQGREQELPVPRPRKPPKAVQYVAVIAKGLKSTGEAQPKLWLVRGEKALFGGLWGVPMVEGSGEAAARLALQAHGLRGRVSKQRLAVVEHVLTHRRMTVEVYQATGCQPAIVEPSAAAALDPSELGTVGVSRLTEKLLSASAISVPHPMRSRS